MSGLVQPADPAIQVTWTQDGTVIVFDPRTGRSASGSDVEEALHELRRLAEAA